MFARCFGVLLLLFVTQQPQSSSKSEDAPVPLTVNEHLKVFKPLIGKSFRGKFTNSTPDKPMHDVSHWERAMNGQAIRILHSVNDGEYGGETIIMWDGSRKTIAYWYFTTAGFHTEGTMEIGDDEWTSTEKVVGNANGITEVKATSRLTSDGNLKVSSQYLSNGKWEKGHEIVYVPTPEAKVVFK